MEEKKYTLEIPFIDQSHSFVRGYECGTIFEKMNKGEALDLTIHSINKEQILLIAKYHDYRIDFQDTSIYEDPDGIYCYLKGAPGPRIH